MDRLIALTRLETKLAGQPPGDRLSFTAIKSLVDLVMESYRDGEIAGRALAQKIAGEESDPKLIAKRIGEGK